MTLRGCFYIHRSKCKIFSELSGNQILRRPACERHKIVPVQYSADTSVKLKLEAFQCTDTENGLGSEEGDILCSVIKMNEMCILESFTREKE